MAGEYEYDQFIVQSLIGNSEWSSVIGTERFFHVGTMPNKHLEIYVADIRMMVASTNDGFAPLAIYARRARKPLSAQLEPGRSSFDQLVTNLSVKESQSEWSSDTSRLLMMDRKDFNQLGVSMDDLISGFVQTCLSVVAIDQLAQYLINSKGRFKLRTFGDLNPDEALLREIML
jgi:hypothetical protein